MSVYRHQPPPPPEFIETVKISTETDIVDRLRDIAAWLRLGKRRDEIGQLCEEAAWEIERLRDGMREERDLNDRRSE